MEFISGREWQYALMLFSMIILIAGFITSRSLPPKSKKSCVQKFACAALIPMALLFLFDRPYVSFVPKTFLFREQKAENLNSFEEIAKFEKDQTRNVELLREEVEKLREELDEVNHYYGGLTEFFVIGLLTFCISRITKKDEDLAEIQKDQILKL
jgi:cell shape-determining protein MreC